MTRRSCLGALFAQQELLVAAASDLSALEPSLRALAGGPVRFSFGSSGMLARQIENGAPFDVFLSADGQRAVELAEKGRLTTPQVYALGRVALWSKSGKWRSLDDLRARPFSHLSIANPAHAPYGRAARQALEHAGLWTSIESRVVLAENVRQAWQFAASGNADLCLTAWSLVHSQGGILVDASLHSPLRQVGGVVKTTSRAARARAFLAAITGEAGRKLLAASGFEVPSQ